MNVAGDPTKPEVSLLPAGPPASGTNTWLMRVRAMMFVVLLAVVTGGGMLFLAGEEKSSTPLGAAAVLDGGLARINGIVPVEEDGWTPPNANESTILDAPTVAGADWVRVVLELTALEREAIPFDPRTIRSAGRRQGRGSFFSRCRETRASVREAP